MEKKRSICQNVSRKWSFENVEKGYPQRMEKIRLSREKDLALVFLNCLRSKETSTLKTNASDDTEQADVHFFLDLVGNAMRPSLSQALTLQLPKLQY